MFTQSDEELSGLESRMLKLANQALDDYENAGENKPLPIALVTLLAKTHDAILKHLSKRSGMDLNMMMKNPETALIQLDKMKAQLMKVIEQRNTERFRLVK